MGETQRRDDLRGDSKNMNQSVNNDAKLLVVDDEDDLTEIKIKKKQTNHKRQELIQDDALVQGPGQYDLQYSQTKKRAISYNWAAS